MKTGIEQARVDLARAEKIAAQDREALATAEQQVLLLRRQLERSATAASSLRTAVRLHDLHARPETPNAKVSGA